MGRFVLVLAVFAVLAPHARADDGSWVTDRGYFPAEGALYSEQGNPDVVLEKEYLELRDVEAGTTRAVFQFHNTSGSAVTVECGFPVSFEFTVRQIAVNGLAAWDFGDVVPSRYAAGQDASPRDKGFLNDVLSALSVLTDPWDAEAALKASDEDPDLYYAGTYFRDDEYPRGRKELDASAVRRLFGFRIVQDGRDVPVPTCVADFEAPGRVVLHFRHQLSFAAGGRSTVTVTYAMPTRSAMSGEPTTPSAPVRSAFTWKYILETASSWKDSLGRIVLAVPAGFEKDLPAPWKYLGTRQGRLFYAAESWRPTPEQNISLEWTTTHIDYVGNWRADGESREVVDLPVIAGPVKLIGASSSLPETADAFLPWGIWRNAPFDAARVFDGRPETAWAVRTPKGGTGEFVRFSVDRSIGRIEVANGYQRSTVDFPDKDTWSYFGKNNRVKTLDIVKDSGGLVRRLELTDTREVQRFDLSLSPGVYRAVIAAVYRGSRWNDTCLGELTFVPGTPTGFDALDGDAFFGPFVR